jgi:peptidoglycan/xylan/chitin deacetylase (PgdA/CDA1 family)
VCALIAARRLEQRRGLLVLPFFLSVFAGIVSACTISPELDTAVTPPFKKVYITFDDGPVDGTRQIIEIINRRQIHVSPSTPA